MTEKVRFSKVRDEYVPYISAAASSYPEYLREDLFQEGMIGLYLACLSFDSERGVPFDAFAKTCIKNRMVTAYRALKTDGKTDALTDEIAVEDADVISSVDSQTFFRDLRKNLSDLENKVLEEYLLEKRYCEIAEKLGVGEKAVENAVQRIRKKIKKHYENTEN